MTHAQFEWPGDALTKISERRDAIWKEAAANYQALASDIGELETLLDDVRTGTSSDNRRKARDTIDRVRIRLQSLRYAIDSDSRSVAEITGLSDARGGAR